MKNIKITDVRCQKGDAAFLIDDGHTSILYDTGFGFTGFDIAKNIKKFLGDRRLDYIFLTHSHYDHALGSAYILRHYPEAEVVAGEYAVDIFGRDGAKKKMCELDRKFAEKCGVTDYDFLGDELRVDISVKDGDVIKSGDMEFEVIYLPGHTRCCIGFYCREKELLLANETLGVYDGERAVVPSFLVSYRETIESIDKIKQLKIKRILAPHYGILTEEQTRFYLDNMKLSAEQTATDIIESLKNEKTIEDIVAEFKNKYWHGYIKEIYPEDAINLNTSIMIRLIQKELI